MRLEDDFDFLAPDDIRLKGTRVGIETVLYEYIHRGRTAEEIADDFPGLGLDRVYATILYYLRHREVVDRYLAQWLDYCRRAEEEFEANPPPVVVRLRKLKAEQEATKAAA